MKSVFFSLCLIILSSCATAEESKPNTSKISLLFSPGFSLELPLNMLEDAKIIDFEGIWIKLKDNRDLSGLIVMNEESGLPEGYKITKYPRYLFGLDSLENLPEKTRKSFQNNRSKLNNRLNNPEVITYSDEDKTYYHACSKTECESYVVKQNNKNQILALFSKGISLELMKSITKGVK